VKKKAPGKPILAPARTISPEDVREIGEVQKKYGVTEKDVQAAFPKTHKRQYREDGTYTWTNDIKTNDGQGKLTKEANQSIELFSNFWRADTERHGKLQSREERVALKDEAGSAHYVPVYKAEETERSNGWRAGHRLLATREDRRHSRRCQGCGELPYWCECA